MDVQTPKKPLLIMATYKTSQKLVAELLATFALVALGCGSAVVSGSEIGYLGIAFAFGFAQLSMVYAVGGISGAHMNPMVTFHWRH